MRLVQEYDFVDKHYGLVEFDNGQREEIKDTDPLAKAMELVKIGVFSPPGEIVIYQVKCAIC